MLLGFTRYAMKLQPDPTQFMNTAETAQRSKTATHPPFSPTQVWRLLSKCRNLLYTPILSVNLRLPLGDPPSKSCPFSPHPGVRLSDSVSSTTSSCRYCFGSYPCSSPSAWEIPSTARPAGGGPRSTMRRSSAPMWRPGQDRCSSMLVGGRGALRTYQTELTPVAELGHHIAAVDGALELAR